MRGWYRLILIAVCGVASVAQAKPARSKAPKPTPAEPAAEAAPSEGAARSTTFYAGAGLAAPEVLPFEFVVRFNESWAVRTYLAPPTLSLNLPVAIPEYDSASGLARIYMPAQQMTPKVTYGAHFGVEGMWFPWSARSFYVLGGLGFRQITADLDEDFDFYLCASSDRNCGSGNPANLHLDGSATSTATLVRGAVGWLWDVGASGYVNLFAIGISHPIGYSLTSELDAEVDSTGLPAWIDGIVNAGLDGAMASYKDAIAQALYDAYGAEYDSMTLPIIGITGGWRF